jgi:hypothetical protein
LIGPRIRIIEGRVMRTALKWILGLSLLAIPMACVTTGLPQPDQESVIRVSGQWPGITVDSLRAGRDDYRINCMACHVLHMPSEFTPQQWKQIVAKMKHKAHIDDATADSILHYLISETTLTDN